MIQKSSNQKRFLETLPVILVLFEDFLKKLSLIIKKNQEIIRNIKNQDIVT